MSALTITHTHADGTLIDGTARGDGSGKILKAQRWRWSRNLGSWYIQNTRDRRAKLAQINATAAALRAAGFTVEIEIDDTYREVAEVEADKIARQQGRVDALDAKADRKAGAAESAWAAEKAAHAALPEGGEPIKVGHHSEGRHRRAVEKSWNALGKAVQSEREAATARGRADAAAKTTDHRYAPVTVARRIDKLAAELKRLERTRDGYSRTLHTNKQTGEKYTEDHAPAGGEYRERVLAEIEHTAEELAYWQGVRAQQIADGKATPYSADVLAKGDHVFYVGQWNEVMKVNAKTVSIRSIVGGSWTDRIAYAEIRGLRDADARPVRIVDGQRTTEPETSSETDAA
ncbi:hypothetical protein RE943_47550 (plasmid) [Prescottella equi]|uniref:Uncharacterized protein n=1 Tax=Rhodococcus hoagii TaxID=43767 RepID=A0A0F6WFN7_RHOHA|nr:DUF3560 domain-containing protein [Prescottella equi]AKF15981.1 hypothetical protein pVAPN2012_0220 [Prescottella equi]ARX59629.1 hypothetical protein pVAPN1204_0220 [Prescottella equi]ARX59772.1 hypothetical protein pVAPN1354_0220 [Prescottella equi]ARX59919.1 hypothetical protein pVAPN1557_0220 [Prescottella equi]BCN46578.1 hypothetical protein RE9414_48580 [Prescottella equi]